VTAFRERRDRAARYGFAATEVPAAGFVAKPGSHDDGPAHGMFLGPLGGPAFSRDLTGRFSRWHLQPGTHVLTDLDCAFFVVHWADTGGQHHAVLRRESVDRHETATLFPVTSERFSGPELPFAVTLSAFSPVVPGLEEEAGLPVVVFDVHVEPVSGGPCPPVDVAFFWPNLNGWTAAPVTPVHRGDRAWPGQHHAGNRNTVARPPLPGAFVLQGRCAVAGAGAAGQVCLSVTAPQGEAAEFTAQCQFKADQNAVGVPPAEQPFTIGAVLHAFAGTGRLGTTPDGSWEAHWHEPLGSAVAAHLRPGGGHARFALAFDWPQVCFGQGRRWLRRYAGAGRGATPLAALAHDRSDAWLAAIDRWHAQTLEGLTTAGWAPAVAGCVVNELGLVTALGSAWVEGNPPGHEPPGAAVLGGREHVGLLEGFDDGYFYYDTSDLWHYAFPALSLHWPRLADVVFTDLADALTAQEPGRRPVYRLGEHRPVLLSDNLPHDLGSAPEDPFVRLNGYVMRDDPNTWRDATPAFVLSRLVHARLSGRPVDDDTWRRLCAAAELTAAQDAAGAGVPRHDEFGDSTWDNLALRGFSTYTAALCAGLWAVLAAESRARGEEATAYERRLAAATRVLDGLWTGEFFRAASEGKYTAAVMPDSVMGLFYAELSGAPVPVERSRIAAHLRSAYEICHRGYADGRVGPLLIGERELRHYGRDGGEELQVNEVLLGSGWLFAAMLRRYGLPAEADDVAGSLCEVLYGGSGLQFRTPAAVDRDGHFRAPLNMRPLAAWWLAAS
jgi:non-lysosomal glucosylceramidase